MNYGIKKEKYNVLVLKSLNLIITKTKLLGAYTNMQLYLIKSSETYFMGLPLEKRSHEKKKEIILMGYFNINILNCDQNKGAADFVDVTYASLLYPTINNPTRITATSKNLIDNRFYDDLTK